jgi:HSP20 family protein
LDTKIVTIKIKEQSEKIENNYLLNERYTGEVSRTFTFSEPLDVENAHVSYADGLLTLTMPRKEVTSKKVLTLKDM